MTAGKEGMSIPAIITAANEMGLTGPTPWDGSSTAKKSHISQVCFASMALFDTPLESSSDSNSINSILSSSTVQSLTYSAGFHVQSVNGDPAFAHVGKSLYALAAFPGVINVPHKRKAKDTLASHGSQASQQTAPASSAPRTSDAAAPAPPSSDAQPSSAAPDSGAPPSLASLKAGAPDAAAGVAGGPAPPGSVPAAFAGLAHGSTAVPPAVLGSLPMMSPQQSAAILAVAAAAAAQRTPPAPAAPAVAEGSVPVSTAVEGGSLGPTAGGSGAQLSSQGNGRS